MSLPRFFLSEQVLAEETEKVFALDLESDDAKHLRVLRLNPGEHIAIIDAASDYFECQIEAFENGVPFVSISRHEKACNPQAYVMLCQGLAKGDKMDTVIRHATELGVTAFHPFSSSRSIVKLDAKKAQARTNRWSAIAKSAAMQSGQAKIPTVSEPASFSTLLEKLSTCDVVCICWEEAPETASLHEALSSALEKPQTLQMIPSIAVVVGPEGGISPDEVQKLLDCNINAHLVSLGSSILRTETAGIVAPALVLYELGMLGSLG